MNRITAIASAALISTGVIAAPQVFAQSSTQGTSSSSSAANANYSDAQLKSFANATESVAALSQNYTKQLQAAGKDQNKIAQIRQEANTKMVAAVKQNGLSVSKFNQIGESLQQNPQLLKRVQAMVQQQQQ